MWRVFLFFLFLTAPLQAQEYRGGSPEFDPPSYYPPERVQQLIEDSMRISCQNGLCQMAMVDTRGRSFVIEVSAGYGPNTGVSGAGGSGGGVVVVNPGGSGFGLNQPFLGVTLRYVNQNCRQYVNIPASLYVSMNTYLYSLVNEDGTIKRTFDPAEQTMILFYTTVLKQANGCSTGSKG
jgi:hypothetical protein